MERLEYPVLIKPPCASAGKLLFGWYDNGGPAIEGDYEYIGPDFSTPAGAWAYAAGER